MCEYLEGLDSLLLFCIFGKGEIFSGKPPVEIVAMRSCL